MKHITNTPSRRVRAWRVEDHGIVIQERENYGDSTWIKDARKKWSDDRVTVTLDELKRILAMVETEVSRDMWDQRKGVV